MQSDKKQRQMKEQIAMYMRKKDYYDILGLSKSCTETQIKKAYKKLALRFHPDKNSVEVGSKEVFKKVSQAYSTLVNAQKKADYDRFGPQEDRQPQYRPRQNGHRHPQDEFQDIFRAFFGGAQMHQRNHHTYTFNMNGRNREQNRPQQGNANAQSNFNFLHIFILISVLYIIPLFFREKPAYSMTQDYQYKVKIQTEIFHIPFYVRTQTVKELQQNNKYWRNVNEKVETQYLFNLYKDCQTAERKRRNFQMQAHRYGPGEERQRLLLKARRQDLTSCRIFSELRENYGQYVRKLLNYY